MEDEEYQPEPEEHHEYEERRYEERRYEEPQTEAPDPGDLSSRGSQRDRRCKFRQVIDDSGAFLARRPHDLLANFSEEDAEGVWHEDTDCPCETFEACNMCEVCINGVARHHPWDELEMLRHGWSDVHGNRWNGARAAEDEVEQLHHGLITIKGAHIGHGTVPRSIRSPDIDPLHLGEYGHVSFGRRAEVRLHVFNPDDRDLSNMIPEKVDSGICKKLSKQCPVLPSYEDVNCVMTYAIPIVSLFLLIYLGRRYLN